MEYRAVRNRCAAILDSLSLPISQSDAMAVLNQNGFRVVEETNLVALARRCIGTSRYRRGAKPSEAPAVVDCSSFTKWLYGQRGIWLPRRSIQQRELGEPIPLENVAAEDLIFVSGKVDYYITDPADGVGHVGIASGENTVIHAANKKTGVIETPLHQFIEKNMFRGARRYIPKNKEVLTFETPPEREIEIAGDLQWVILQSLPQ
ncbi:MAG: C40 family peptidase [Candidatus Liptonbacteria bacterium]|nr:C40 family peptidase [Candidatus Liptonbacteria bacterium]